MADYLKRAKDKVSEIATAATEKAKAIGASLAKIATGNDGSLGNAKGSIAGRQKQIEDATDKAVGMRHGGRVGYRPQRG